MAMHSGGVQGDDKKSKSEQAAGLPLGLAVSRDWESGDKGESQILEGRWSCLPFTIEPTLSATPLAGLQPVREHGAQLNSARRLQLCLSLLAAEHRTGAHPTPSWLYFEYLQYLAQFEFLVKDLEVMTFTRTTVDGDKAPSFGICPSLSPPSLPVSFSHSTLSAKLSANSRLNPGWISASLVIWFLPSREFPLHPGHLPLDSRALSLRDSPVKARYFPAEPLPLSRLETLHP